MDKKALGRWGEQVAVDFLRQRGFEILQQNFQTRMGEIDIIAKDGDTYCFVEVKTRQSLQYGPPSDAVSRSKQRTIIKVALMYMNEHDLDDVDMRFDVVTIDIKNPDEPQVELLEDAIDCSFYG